MYVSIYLNDNKICLGPQADTLTQGRKKNKIIDREFTQGRRPLVREFRSGCGERCCSIEWELLGVK